MSATRPTARRSSRLLRGAVAGLCALSVVTTLPAVAQAAPTPAEMRKAEALATEGKVFFRSKLYKEAALQFMEAYALSRRPSLVYNAARAYEEGGYDTKAIALFRHYESLPEVDAAGKAAAKQRLAKLEARVRAKAAAEAAKKAAADRATKAAEAKRAAAAKAEAAKQAAARRAAEARAAQAAEARRAAAARAEARRARPKRTLSVPLAATGGALAVVAGASYGVALSVANDMSASEVVDNATKSRYLGNRDKAQLWRGVAVGAGVAAVGVLGWTAWQWWRSDAPKGRATLQLVPTASSAHAGLALSGRF